MGKNILHLGKTFFCLSSVCYVFDAQSQDVENITIIGNPIIEENIIDAFSSTSTLITKQQIQDQNAVDLAAALRTVPSVQISRFNPVGAFGGDEGGGVFIRGLGSSRPGSEIKTYIDGVPFYMGLWNHPLLDLLPLNGMESITVHKAPQIHVNGNNFASINLTTQKASDEGLTGNAKITGGEFDTFTQQVDISGRSGKFDYMFAQGYATSNGHRENAEGELKNVMGRVGYDITPNWHVSGFLLHTDNKAKDPGEEGEEQPEIATSYNTKATLGAITLAHQHTNWEGSLRVYANSGDGDWLDQADDAGDTLTHFAMQGFQWKESARLWHNGLLVMGVDHDDVSGDIYFNPVSSTENDAFEAPTFRMTSPHISASHNLAVNTQWTLTPSVGIRYYDHSDFDAESTPQLGLSLASDNLTFFAQFSSGVNYPGLEVTTLSHLIPALGTSWQMLDVETLDHYEIGFNIQLETQTNIDFAVFENHIDNRYVFAFPPLVSEPQFTNIGSYTIRGTELAIKHTLTPNWALFASMSLLDPTIDNLPYAPERFATTGLNGQWQAWRISLDAQYQSKVWALNQTRTAGDTNTEQVPSFFVANARIGYALPALGNRGEIFIAVENMFDRDYAYRPGYTMPGRWAQLGITASF